MKDVKIVLLKKKLEEVNKEIQQLEIKAAIFSERDYEVVKECDAKIAVLNAEYLDIDDQLQTLEKQVA